MVPPVVSATLSNVALLSTRGSWLVTARPARTLPPTDSVAFPTVVQFWPSAETAPVIVDPTRVNLSQAGEGCIMLAIQIVGTPVFDRAMNSISPVGRRSRMTCGASAAADPRIITPAFAYVFVLVRFATRATTCPSPASGWLTY